MITPSQIREKKISTVESGGYDRDEVNNLLLEIIDSYEAVLNENKELYRKMEILANRIEEYRADEDSIKSALITAEKMAAKLTSEAKEKAEETLSNSAKSAQQTVVDAKAKADKIIGEAREYVAGLTKEKAQAADEIINEARVKANEAIDSANIVANNALSNAKKLAQEIVTKAKAEKDYHTEIVTKLRDESKGFRETLISLYETQLDKIKDLAAMGDEFSPENREIEEIEEELNKLLEGIDDNAEEYEAEETENEPVTQETVEEQQADEQETAEQEDEKEPLEFELDETDDNVAEDDGLTLEEEPIADEVDQIIDQLEAMDESAFEPVEEEEEQPPTQEEVENAINSFSADEITPIDESVKSIPVIDDEPEFESAMPFESFFDTNKGHLGTDEAISLIPPDDDDEEEGNSKFKGFFKKKK